MLEDIDKFLKKIMLRIGLVQYNYSQICELKLRILIPIILAEKYAGELRFTSNTQIVYFDNFKDDTLQRPCRSVGIIIIRIELEY